MGADMAVKKCVLVVLDGLGDRSHACLGHKTPLEAAGTPHLDRLAALGCNGLHHAGYLGQARPCAYQMLGQPFEAGLGLAPLMP